MAEKLPSGHWRRKVTWSDADGKKHSKSFTAPTKREVDNMVQEFIYSKKKNGSLLTVGEAVDKLIELNDSIYSPSTPRTYQKIKRNWLTDIVDIKLEDLDDITIQRWINNICAHFISWAISWATLSRYTHLDALVHPCVRLRSATSHMTFFSVFKGVYIVQHRGLITKSTVYILVEMGRIELPSESFV